MNSAALSDHIVYIEVCDMGPVSAPQIATGTGLSESAVRRALSRLESAGIIESDRDRHRARTYLPRVDEP
jgi:predicted ArsR family transcriptional regulator